jgi:phage gpG-like protein
MAGTLTFTMDISQMRLKLSGLTAVVTDAQVLEPAGRWMANSGILDRFDAGGPGWPPPRYRSGRPLMDSGTLRSNWAHQVVESEGIVEVAPSPSAQVYAALQHYGGTVVPKTKQWLMIPLSPPLAISERKMPPRSFKAFFLEKGPEGPGLYRRSQKAVSVSLKAFKSGKNLHKATKYAAGTKSIERIFAARKSVTIPPRPFAYWSEHDAEVVAAKTLHEIQLRIEKGLL